MILVTFQSSDRIFRQGRKTRRWRVCGRCSPSAGKASLGPDGYAAAGSGLTRPRRRPRPVATSPNCPHAARVFGAASGTGVGFPSAEAVIVHRVPDDTRPVDRRRCPPVLRAASATSLTSVLDRAEHRRDRRQSRRSTPSQRWWLVPVVAGRAGTVRSYEDTPVARHDPRPPGRASALHVRRVIVSARGRCRHGGRLRRFGPALRPGLPRCSRDYLVGVSLRAAALAGRLRGVGASG